MAAKGGREYENLWGYRVGKLPEGMPGRRLPWIDLRLGAHRYHKRATRTPEYLAKFPQGQVPAIEFDDGRCLSQSNAIMRYLARGSPLLPEDAWAQAKIDEWLFWEQYSHEPYIAVCRFQMLYQGKPRAAREAWRVERGEKAFDLMEGQLVGREWLATGRFTIADIALLPYSRLAHEGGFDLSGRPGLIAWISRCENALGA